MSSWWGQRTRLSPESRPSPRSELGPQSPVPAFGWGLSAPVPAQSPVPAAERRTAQVPGPSRHSLWLGMPCCASTAPALLVAHVHVAAAASELWPLKPQRRPICRSDTCTLNMCKVQGVVRAAALFYPRAKHVRILCPDAQHTPKGTHLAVECGTDRDWWGAGAVRGLTLVRDPCEFAISLWTISGHISGTPCRERELQKCVSETKATLFLRFHTPGCGTRQYPARLLRPETRRAGAPAKVL